MHIFVPQANLSENGFPVTIQTPKLYINIITTDYAYSCFIYIKQNENTL